VLFLAFRFELPVIAFDVGALREYIQHDAGVLAQGRSAKDFAGAIGTFHRERRQFAPAQVEEYTQAFRWARVVEPLIDAYEVSS
jgi:glycosyltransferase involved in cell wall biosynthesis